MTYGPNYNNNNSNIDFDSTPIDVLFNDTSSTNKKSNNNKNSNNNNNNKSKNKSNKKEKLENKSGDDFLSMITDFLKNLPLKIAFFIFIIFILLRSDFFINNILAKFNGTVEYTNQTTTKGEIITGIFLILGYICIDLVIQYNIL
ncbi:MAG: hypothetical protein KIT69_15220 [Propionibacteriaceae bacterium]|nr:hypothetical protein [Propionibacteriaceae bacterium]